MDKYKDFLAAKVLHESQVVSYRTLSRALKIHVDLAKQMLWDFHHKQTAKKPGCCHATYLITGYKTQQPSQQANGVHSQDMDGDSLMRSSPPMSSMTEQGQEASSQETLPSVVSISLCPEEQLEEIKSQYSDILSSQVYSLEPGPIQNIYVLSNCNQEIASQYASEDPLERWKTYGGIRNPSAKKRKVGTPMAPLPKPKPTTAGPKTIGGANRPNTALKSEKENREPTTTKMAHGAHAAGAGDVTKSDAIAEKEKEEQRKKEEAKKPNLKRGNSGGGLANAFAKTKPPKPKEASKAEREPSPPDEEMEDVSEGENEEVAAKKRKVDAAERKERQDREEQTRKMMEEQSDEEMKDPEEEAKDSNDELLDDVKEEEQQEEKKPAPEPEPEPEKKEEITTSGGRRRGRRRVMKKKTTKDEDGYLVTKEEAVWEEFSEDEPKPLPKKKPAPAPAPAKGGNKGAKKGQGNIMNFFAKK